MNCSIRKTSFGLLIAVLSFVILSGAFGTSYAEEKFEVELKVGFDGYVIPEETMPVRIEIKNNFDNFEGKVQLLVQDNRNQKDFYTAYSKKINIAEGSTKIINMESIFYRNGSLYVRVLDKSDSIVYEKMVKYLKLNDSNGLYMGIFSENVDSLRYLSKAYNKTNGNGGRQTFFEIVELDETLPENYKTLELFRTIIINNYDSEKLDIKQRKALKDWIEAGGLLIVGTGPNHQKTLRGLEEISFLDVHGTKEINIEKLGSQVPLKLIDASLKDNENTQIEDKDGLTLYHKNLGRGHVVIAGFDLGLSPFATWNEKDKFMNEVINKHISNDLNSNTSQYPKAQYNRFTNITSYLPYNLLPSVKSILIILILFILLVGPVNYIVLKKIDKRELLWITIPIIVVLFSGSIYVLGFKTRLRQPIVNNVSIINVDTETNTAMINTKSGIMGFKNGAWDVTFDKTSEVILKDRRDYDVLQRFAEKEVVTEYVFDKENHVIFNKAAILDVETVTINNEIKLDNEIISEIIYKDGKFTGTINNISNLNLEDIVIFYGDKYEKLGDLKEGEKSKKIELNASSLNSKNKVVKDWYATIDSLYRRNHGYKAQNIKDDTNNILNDNIKRDILDGLFNSKYFAINQNRFFMIAWNKDEIGENIKINGKEAKRIDRNLIILPLNIKYERGEKIVIPYGVLYPEVVDIYNMHYETYRAEIFGEGHVVFGFKPQEKIELISMEIDLTNFNNSTFESYIFNFSTNEWEMIDKSKIVIDNSNVNLYYQRNKGTLIKIDPMKDREVYIPSFTVEGVYK